MAPGPLQPPIRTLPISSIDIPHPTNGRLDTNPAATCRLRDQIAANGLLHPITVRPAGTRYELIAGRHRIDACQRLGWTHIPATILPIDDYAAATIRLAENLTRSNLTPVEEAAQLHDLVEANPNGVDGVAATIGRRPAWILDRLEILTWDDPIQIAVHERALSLAAARRLARIPDPQDRQRYVSAAINHGASARTAALWLNDALNANTPPTDQSDFSAHQPASEQHDPALTYCYICQTPEKIVDMVYARLCRPCANTIRDLDRHTPPPEQIPQNA